MIEPNKEPSRNQFLVEGASYKPHTRNAIDDPHLNFERIRTLVKVSICINCNRRKEHIEGSKCSTRDGLVDHVYEERTVRR